MFYLFGRLSRARRCVENAFGILANRWRVFRSAIPLEPEKVKHLVLASTALHNYLRKQRNSRFLYTPPEYVDREDVGSGEVVPGQWRCEVPLESMLELRPVSSNNYSNEAKMTRDEFKEYFNSNGAVSWQNNLYH